MLKLSNLNIYALFLIFTSWRCVKMALLSKRKKVNIPSFTNIDLPLDSLPENIHDIMKLVQLTNQDIETLHLIDDLMEAHVDTIADRHYQMIMDIPEIKDIFNTFTTYDRYVPAIIDYFKQLTKPELNEQYIENRIKIGKIHSRIQLTEEWFIGSYMRVYEYLVPHIVSKFSSQPQKLSAILVALNRIITFDTIIVLKAYEQANEFQLVDKLSGAMDEMTKIDEVGSLLSVVEQTTNEANLVDDATKQLNQSVDEIASTADTASQQTKLMVEQASESKEVVEASLNGFMNMIEDFQKSKEDFQSLTRKVNNISEVIDFIKGIADETNLLALNASIEAARAGEHGLGFAVVANEVRKLAEQTKESVNHITNDMTAVQEESTYVSESIENFSSHLAEHMKETRTAMKAIDTIMSHIGEVNQAISTIADITKREASSSEEISEKMSHLNDHFERTKQLTMITGQSVYQAGSGVNQIRLSAIDTIKNPTKEQQNRINETESQVTSWHQYNQVHGFSN